MSRVLEKDFSHSEDTKPEMDRFPISPWPAIPLRDVPAQEEVADSPVGLFPKAWGVAAPDRENPLQSTAP